MRSSSGHLASSGNQNKEGVRVSSNASLNTWLSRPVSVSALLSNEPSHSMRPLLISWALSAHPVRWRREPSGNHPMQPFVCSRPIALPSGRIPSSLAINDNNHALFTGPLLCPLDLARFRPMVTRAWTKSVGTRHYAPGFPRLRTLDSLHAIT